MIQLQIATGAPPIPAVARYHRGDNTLVVGPGPGAPHSDTRASVDSVTLLFHSPEHRFVGLDAYTNAERWEQRALDLPTIEHFAALDCLATFDVNGIAAVSAGPVRYAYAADSFLLRIQFDGSAVASRVRCLSCVVGGLDAGGRLAELWVQGLEL